MKISEKGGTVTPGDVLLRVSFIEDKASDGEEKKSANHAIEYARPVSVTHMEGFSKVKKVVVILIASVLSLPVGTADVREAIMIRHDLLSSN